jgi:hypothetical protein
MISHVLTFLILFLQKKNRNPPPQEKKVEVKETKEEENIEKKNETETTSEKPVTETTEEKVEKQEEKFLFTDHRYFFSKVLKSRILSFFLLF